jgi:GH18 family chitinase
MKVYLKHPLVLLLVFFLTISATSLHAQTPSFRIIGYVPNWIDVTTFAQNFDYTKVTHLNYAFQNPNASGDLVDDNNGLTVLVAKAHQNKVKVLISLGGADSANPPLKTYFQNLISTFAQRAAFIHKIVVYLNKFKLDGLDVDEEGPAINSNYGVFIKQLSDSLKPKGLLLSSAVGWGNENIPNTAFQYFDWVNLMAYDLTGNWDQKNPGQHSPYTYAQQMISDFKKRGVTKGQLCLGVPFYGYGFYKLPGSFNYVDILAKYPDAWGKDQVGDTIYYNGMPTIRKKTKLALSDASGIMIWELSNDAIGSKSLLNVIASTVDSLQTSTAVNLKLYRSLKIYPNPAGNELIIENLNSGQTTSIEVLTIQGELVKTANLQKRDGSMARIDVSSLHVGTYLCRIISPEGNYAKMFVKE